MSRWAGAFLLSGLAIFCVKLNFILNTSYFRLIDQIEELIAIFPRHRITLP